MKKIFFISLGCPKNLVDSETLLALLGEKSCAVTSFREEADIIIVNTCGFLKDAVRESEETIKKLAREKKKGQKLIVYGCLVQRYGSSFPDIKGVDATAGACAPLKVIEAIQNIPGTPSIPIEPQVFSLRLPDYIKGNYNYPRLITTFPYAYIKISEGCENFCSYCLIPKIRGPLVSRRIEDILKEARSIEGMGIKELILVAQDTANYGKDLKEKHGLERLLEKLSALNFRRMRIMYLHPAHLTDGMLKTIASEPKICRYLDIPLQHIHPDMLKKMNRPVLDYGRIVDRIRTAVPGIRLRTTLITGFPGEKGVHFKAMEAFVKEREFDRLGVFRYSREEGTPAYGMNGQVPEKVKREREKRIMELQREISRRKLKKLKGEEMEVLVEGKKGRCFTGRTEFDAPDIDGTVYIKTKKQLKTGDFCRVKITSSDNYDLFASY
ncbi:MAG: 30S ribosomal protein S12 methylthiotransferase RimO [Candidatus Omnitrophica bacterium]|nr:30S ribosomal protein S12 methylthiotransferase RimO [Candidatus Omnitrophota bacterium]